MLIADLGLDKLDTLSCPASQMHHFYVHCKKPVSLIFNHYFLKSKSLVERTRKQEYASWQTLLVHAHSLSSGGAILWPDTAMIL